MKKEQKYLIKFASYIGIIVFIILCVTHDSKLDVNLGKTLLGFIGDSVTISIFFSIVYERYLWKYNPLESRPRLSKRYEGKLHSNFDNIDRNVKIEISQTLTTTHVAFHTDESRSNAISADIVKQDEQSLLIYTYLNIPNAQVRSNSPMHYGTVVVSINEQNELEGNYFTDRKTTGYFKVFSINK